jgi:hypothetical protein
MWLAHNCHTNGAKFSMHFVLFYKYDSQMPYKVLSNAKISNHEIENMFMKEFLLSNKKVHLMQHKHVNIRMLVP